MSRTTPLIPTLKKHVAELSRCTKGLAMVRTLNDSNGLTLQSQWLREIEDEANAILKRVRFEAQLVREARETLAARTGIRS